jgi:hypothetical protein
MCHKTAPGASDHRCYPVKEGNEIHPYKGNTPFQRTIRNGAFSYGSERE